MKWIFKLILPTKIMHRAFMYVWCTLYANKTEDSFNFYAWKEVNKMIHDDVIPRWRDREEL